MSSYKVETVTRQTILGEAPHWLPESQTLYYLDIFGSTVYRYVATTGKVYKLSLGELRPTFILPLEGQSNKFVIGTQQGQLQLLEWDGQSSNYNLKTIVSIEDKYPGARFNDAKCDPQGRIWVGTFSQTETGAFVDGKGVLFSLDLNGKLTEQVDKINLSNGLAWSKDSSKFYFADSNAYVVYVFDFDGINGTLSNQRVLFDLKKNDIPGIPDGIAIDAEDNLWVAVFGGATVLHVDGRTGALLGDSIDLKGKSTNITSVAFGGPNLDILYVTSATYGLTPEQLAAGGTEVDAGAVFAVTNLGTKAPSPAVNYKGKLAL